MNETDKQLRFRVKEGTTDFQEPTGKLLDLLVLGMTNRSTEWRCFNTSNLQFRRYIAHSLGNAGESIHRFASPGRNGKSRWEYISGSSHNAQFDFIVDAMPPSPLTPDLFYRRPDLKSAVSIALNNAIAGNRLVAFSKDIVSVRDAWPAESADRTLTLVRFPRGDTTFVPPVPPRPPFE